MPIYLFCLHFKCLKYILSYDHSITGKSQKRAELLKDLINSALHTYELLVYLSNVLNYMSRVRVEEFKVLGEQF